MGIIRTDLSLVQESEHGLKSKCVGLGSGEIDEAKETNICGVKNSASVYKESTSILKAYKELLDTDADRIKSIGVMFFDFDHDMAGKMKEGSL